MTRHTGKELQGRIQRKRNRQKDKELHNMMNARGKMRKVKRNLERKINETERTKATKSETTRERTGDRTTKDKANRDKAGKNEPQRERTTHNEKIGDNAKQKKCKYWEI